MEQIILYPKYLDAVKYAIETHSECAEAGLENGVQDKARKVLKSFQKGAPRDTRLNTHHNGR